MDKRSSIRNTRPGIREAASADDNPFAIGWQGRLVCDVTALLADLPGWGPALERASRLHLACMLEPWAAWIEDGSKLVESRWARTNRAPHNRVGAGDVIVWKRSGGAIYGASVVQHAITFPIPDDEQAERVARAWSHIVRVDPESEHWRGKRYATFVRIVGFTPIAATVRCGKRDRAGWNVLQDPSRCP